jgi:predicted transcriptional regulator
MCKSGRSERARMLNAQGSIRKRELSGKTQLASCRWRGREAEREREQW